MPQEKRTLNRDIQIITGEEICTLLQGQYLDNSLFNLLTCTPIIRASSIRVLSKLSVFILNRDAQAQISTPDGKYSLCIDLTKITGYLYFDRFVEEVKDSIKEVHLLSLQDADVQKLIKILEKIKGIKVISLPYDFGNCRTTKKLERLIQNNARTLVALKHLVLPMSMPIEMRDRLVAINSSTLRYGSSEKESDFYAYYAEGAKYPECLDPLPEKGILMRISIHRSIEPFRAAKRAFNENMLNKISVLNLISISNFETKSAQQFLEHISGAKKYFSKLELLQFEMRMLDTWPSHYSTIFDEFSEDDDYSHVSAMTNDSQLVSNCASAWLHGHSSLPFRVEAKVRLLVDYFIGDNEKSEEVLEKAMKQTELYFGQRFDRKMEWTKNSGQMLGSAIQQISQNIQLEFVLDYRSISYCKNAPKENKCFRIEHSL